MPRAIVVNRWSLRADTNELISAATDDDTPNRFDGGFSDGLNRSEVAALGRALDRLVAAGLTAADARVALLVQPCGRVRSDPASETQVDRLISPPVARRSTIDGLDAGHGLRLINTV